MTSSNRSWSLCSSILFSILRTKSNCCSISAYVKGVSSAGPSNGSSCCKRIVASLARRRTAKPRSDNFRVPGSEMVSVNASKGFSHACFKYLRRGWSERNAAASKQVDTRSNGVLFPSLAWIERISVTARALSSPQRETTSRKMSSVILVRVKSSSLAPSSESCSISFAGDQPLHSSHFLSGGQSMPLWYICAAERRHRRCNGVSWFCPPSLSTAP
mmetsp:Transcript_28896/g.68713  ORF Transcript_28896/g.68713 Transcript_28896/m.68713 type:complete len:216 (-) Transcript_28896:820-1467(-)